jgi:hypothetical protein
MSRSGTSMLSTDWVGNRVLKPSVANYPVQLVGRYTEHKYLMKMMQLLDVNVDADIVELLAYAKKYAGLDVELSRDERPATTSVVQRARKVLGDREPSGAC